MCVCVLCREMVKGSHLRPLEKKDKDGGSVLRQPWNAAASDGVTGGEVRGEGVSLVEGEGEMSLQSFVREWRKLSTHPQDQYKYTLCLNIFFRQCVCFSKVCCVYW